MYCYVLERSIDMKPLWRTLLVLFAIAWVSGANAQDHASSAHIDAPLWPLMLGSPLETISLSVHVVGEKPVGLKVNDIEAECLAYLQQSLKRISSVAAISYGDWFGKRVRYNNDSTVRAQY